jgi:peptidoglycan/xylan/chitin deacetylase (PgdA/CDA1 family)
MSAVMGSRKAGGAGILFYHRIAPPADGLPEPGLNVTPGRFRRQIEGLIERQFRFVPLRLLIDWLSAGEPVPAKTAVVTFDDAFAGVYRWALPVLRELDVPATVFAVTDYVGRSVPMHFDMWGLAHHESAPEVSWRSMNWAECREAEDTGLIEIGCHTHSHQNFTGRADELRADLRTAQRVFSEELGGPRPLFAIPYGDPALGQVDDALLRAAREEGLECALTTQLGVVEPGQSPFGWKRLEVVQGDTGATLAAKIEGWYDWMGTVKGAVHRVAPW